MIAQQTSCTPSELDCPHRQGVNNVEEASHSALLLGPMDADVEVVLRQMLEASSLSFLAQGPLLALPGSREQHVAIGALLRERLSPYAQTRIRAAYAPNGTSTTEQALAAMLYAEPLSAFLENLKHEWVRDVLHDDWLFSVFQPIMEAKTGDIFAYEALLRARHPQTQEMIGAGPLVHACNMLNLQHELDQLARQVAIRDAAALSIPEVRFFINFLPNAIYSPEICLRTTIAAAEEWDIELHRLVFEVVEIERITNIPHLRSILDYCRKQGIGTAVDDIGAGFSSQEYLTALCPDYVKIEGDIISQAERDPQAHRKLDALVRMANQLNACIIAKGIETRPQMQLCMELGVDYLQGFLLATPANPPVDVASGPWFGEHAAA